ncbi:MAG TPA: hypothetical protein VGC30_07400 [Dokdonella sp.]
MRDARGALRRALLSGSVASVLSTLVITWRGARDRGRAAAGTNATSQWLWGRRAKRSTRPDLAHTAVGYAIHHGSSLFWAAFYEHWQRARPTGAAAAVVARAVAVAAAACFVDYRVTPERLRPGFEAHLTRRSLVLVYAAFAAGLAATTLARRVRCARRPRRRVDVDY